MSAQEQINELLNELLDIGAAPAEEGRKAAADFISQRQHRYLLTLIRQQTALEVAEISGQVLPQWHASYQSWLRLRRSFRAGALRSRNRKSAQAGSPQRLPARRSLRAVLSRVQRSKRAEP